MFPTTVCEVEDILDDFGAATARPSQSYPGVEARLELAVLHRPTGVRGRITRFTGEAVEVRDTSGAKHMLRNRPGAFAVNGETVALVRPVQQTGGDLGVTPRAWPRNAAHRVRSWSPTSVRGWPVRRVSGWRVTTMHASWSGSGATSCARWPWWSNRWAVWTTYLPRSVASRPGPGRSLVVLADHLVPGSKERRIADGVDSPHVLVVGHPYVDIWQCVRARSLGIDGWPEVPMGEDWKTGVCARLGWGTPREGWRRVLAAADDLSDLDPVLVNALERALDHFTSEGGPP